MLFRCIAAGPWALAVSIIYMALTTLTNCDAETKSKPCLVENDNIKFGNIGIETVDQCAFQKHRDSVVNERGR